MREGERTGRHRQAWYDGVPVTEVEVWRCYPPTRGFVPVWVLDEQETTMDFSGALTEIKAGKKLMRERWNAEGMFIFLVPGSRFEVNREPLLGIYPEGTEIDYHAHIDMRLSTGEIMPWLAAQCDLLADDWRVVL